MRYAVKVFRSFIFIFFYFILVSDCLASSKAELAKTTITEKEIAEVFLELYPNYIKASSNKQLLFKDLSQEKPIVEIEIIREESANAFAVVENQSFSRILLTSALIKQIILKEQLAFILAHEMGHVVLGHSRPNLSNALLSDKQVAMIKEIEKKHELLADKHAIESLKKAGINNKAATSILKELHTCNRESSKNRLVYLNELSRK